MTCTKTARTFGAKRSAVGALRRLHIQHHEAFSSISSQHTCDHGARCCTRAGPALCSGNTTAGFMATIGLQKQGCGDRKQTLQITTALFRQMRPERTGQPGFCRATPCSQWSPLMTARDPESQDFGSKFCLAPIVCVLFDPLQVWIFCGGVCSIEKDASHHRCVLSLLRGSRAQGQQLPK